MQTGAEIIDFEYCWRIRKARDHYFDGRLFVAITTTAIYCKPSCPSRHARPEHTRFFESREDAERAGFRPCLRCKPTQEDASASLVRRVVNFIEAHPDESLTLDQLSTVAGVSPFHLQRTFKKATGVTPKGWAKALRMRRFQTALREAPTVTDAVYQAGFHASSRAYASAGTELGMKPGDWRKSGGGASIRFTVTDTEFGPLLAAVTRRGICAVRLGSSAQDLEAEFRKDFARAELIHDPTMTDLIDEIVRQIATPQSSFLLPVDVQATAFQQRVWDHLRTIPRGETRSYSQVAAEIHAPTAVRAVARACASNQVALIIPCHRVVGADGKLTGYKWGTDLKRKLLAKEREDS